VEPWGQGGRKAKHWHSSYIQKLMTNSAVIGTFTPHREIKTATGRKREPQQPIEGYFPVVVDRDVFARVSAQAKARAARGRHADNAPKSVFAGLLRCARCGDTVIRVVKSSKVRGRYVYLVCSKAHARAGCEYAAMRYHDAEKRIIETVKVLVEEAPRGRDTADIEAEIKNLDAGYDVLVDQARELADIAATEKSDAARRRLREREEQLEEVGKRLRDLRARRDTLASASVLRRLEAVERVLTQRRLNVGEANKVLKQAVSKIVMDADDGTLTFHWHHADEPSYPITFAWPRKYRSISTHGVVSGQQEGTT
jgi:Recombinase zinc beta ribbon domain/Recombinase